MIFVVEYSRREGKLVSFKSFLDSQRTEAEELRLKTELELHRKGWDHEAVLFDAESEEMLRRTHRRYFESLNQLLKEKRPQSIPFSEKDLQEFRQSGGGLTLAEFMRENGLSAK